MGLVDDEIARLEKELAQDSGSDSSDDSDDSSDGGVACEVVADGVLASLEQERIAPLRVAVCYSATLPRRASRSSF